MTTENVEVRCLACMARFVTSPMTLAELDRGEDRTVSCPACGQRSERPLLTDDGLLTPIPDDTVTP